MKKFQKYTLHNESGDFMGDSAGTISEAIKKCKEKDYKCYVAETYLAKSPWRPWDDKLVEHGKEVYRNF